MRRLLAKLNKLTNRQVAYVFVVVGFVVFITGLNNPFQGDDSYQIVNNTPVHSIANLPTFFDHSTFYNGESLVGTFYRPMMTTVFSLLYTLFGANPLPYHVVQLALYIAGAFLAYLVFKHFFKKAYIALGLALVFLVHPLNSQVAYAIPTMQDALVAFFGMLALWLLIKHKSERSLWGVAACLLLAMLSKESGILFAVLAAGYLFWFERKRLKPYLLVMIVPIILYAALKVHAVGLLSEQHIAPIDEASLATRLFTMPSIVLFYITQFVFPLHLATGYYWLYSSFGLWTVLVPLLLDIIIVGAALFVGTRLSKQWRKLYWFFATWAALGILPYLQIIKLDMTACETWFRFAMIGVLGMIGVCVLAWGKRIRPEWFVIAVLVLIAAFGVRTVIRGTDYNSQYNLAMHDVAVAPQNHSALNNIAQYLIDHEQYQEAALYARRSVEIYPLVTNYLNLGVALQQSGDYPGAIGAYKKALEHGDLAIAYENLGLIYVVYGDAKTTEQFLAKGLQRYPRDFRLWLYTAVYEGSRGSEEKAKTAITNAARYGPVPASFTEAVTGSPNLSLPLLGKTVIIR